MRGNFDVAKTQKSQGRRKSRPLYHAAKISDQRFKQVLWHFAKDDTATEAAQRTGLSLNAVNTIFLKLRRFFVEAGMFTDIYQGGDPKDGYAGDPSPEAEQYELHLIEFHFARLKNKRGVGSGESEGDHWCESHWRFHYVMLMEDRGGDAVHSMMHRHMLEMIRRCGPVGKPSVNQREGIRLCLAQMDERILWAHRNSPAFRSGESRKRLKDVIDC